MSDETTRGMTAQQIVSLDRAHQEIGALLRRWRLLKERQDTQRTLYDELTERIDALVVRLDTMEEALDFLRPTWRKG